MISRSILGCVGIISVAYAAAIGGGGDGPVVETANGKVLGKELDSKVNAWMGIPFASPPERFSPPVDAKPWKHTLDATKSKPSCIQQFNYPEVGRNLTIKIFSTPLPAESEDCLYLNVFAPSGKAPSGGFPVMFWIYGGNLQFGHAALPMYSGEELAAKHGVVVVAANYRTNVFGFPGSPELKKGENNLGFLDQRKALAWTTKNIAKFGGDPSKVTLFGESAGGYSVKQLLVNPPSPLPFRAAIMQSQASGNRGGAESWAKLTAALKCPTTGALACVRKAPASAIKDLLERQSIGFGPEEDSLTQVNDVRNLIKTGKSAKVPVILGTNLNEGTPFAAIAMSTPGVTLAKFFGAFVPGGTEVAEAVIAQLRPLYDAKVYDTDKKLGSAMFTDLGFTCGTSTVASTLQDAGYDVYRYFYTASYKKQWPFEDAGAFHSAEIEAIFGTYDRKIKEEIHDLSKNMQAVWTGFAKDPKAALPGWSKLGSGTAAKLNKLETSGKVVVVPTSEVDSRCAVIGPLSEAGGV